MTTQHAPSPQKRVDFDLKQNSGIEDEPTDKRGRLCVVTAGIFISNLAQERIIRSMPLDLDNGLPGILLRLGRDARSETCFLCHVDSCAAMNTGNLLLHQYIITNHPEIVAEYIQYDDVEPFDPIQLQCAVTESTDTPAEQGKLTAIVRYYTPYQYTDGSPVLVSFGLGRDVAVRSIIGLPTLRQWKSSVDFLENKLLAPGIRRRFDLHYEKARQGLPSGAMFANTDFQRPQQATIATIAAQPEYADGVCDGTEEDLKCHMQRCTVQDDTSDGHLKRTVTTPHL